MKSAWPVFVGPWLLAGPAPAQAQFDYSTNNGTITITRYSGPGGAVIISSQTNGLPVTAIGDGAFSDYSNLTSVVMLAGVADIGQFSFAGCTSLTNVAIPSSVTNIDVAAFNNCGGLANAAISVGLTSIGNSAFAYCGNLGNVNLPDGLTNVGDQAFFVCGLGTLTIPGSVIFIGYDAVNDCQNLTSVTISNGVTSLGFNMFTDCTSLTNVTIPGSATNIASYAFSGCSSLRSVTLLAGVTDIESQAFIDCTSLTNVTIPSGVTTIGTYAFQDCSSLTSLVTPSTVTNFGAGALAAGSSLTNLFFQGNAPDVSENDIITLDGPDLVVYYLLGTTGWSNFASAGSYPVLLWNPQIQVGGGNFGVKNNQFGFDITGTTNIPIVVEASTNLASADWIAVQSLTLTNGLSYFSDAQWTNCPARYYRITPP
jgi:hypothetical protein